MKRLRPVAVGLAMLALSGCATPELMSANARGGVVKHANGTNEAAAFALADAYCRKNRRVAQITGTDVVYNLIHFACVEP